MRRAHSVSNSVTPKTFTLTLNKGLYIYTLFFTMYASVITDCVREYVNAYEHLHKQAQ